MAFSVLSCNEFLDGIALIFLTAYEMVILIRRD